MSKQNVPSEQHSSLFVHLFTHVYWSVNFLPIKFGSEHFKFTQVPESSHSPCGGLLQAHQHYSKRKTILITKILR